MAHPVKLNDISRGQPVRLTAIGSVDKDHAGLTGVCEGESVYDYWLNVRWPNGSQTIEHRGFLEPA